LAGPLEGQRRLSEIIVRESDRLDGIVENFLRFARPTAAAPCAVDVHSLVSEAVVLLRNRHETAARVISWTPSAEAMTIRADRGQLVQVLLNLGINAIQATSPSSGRIGFEVRRSGEQAVEIQVWDNGKGIPAADQRKVFQPFFTTKEGGSGLGLSIVEKIIQEHGGTVEVESAEGAGTRFVLLLPAAAAVVADSTGSRDHFPAAACRA
jgi:signal transduction histidine kinase